MRTKVVYVLTSDSEDFFLEQALISIVSLRLHNKSANISLLTDKDTKNYCEGSSLGQTFLKCFDEVVTVDASQYETKAQRSRHLKTSMRNMIDGDMLFVDGDTVICDSLAEIDNVDADFAAVLDGHSLICKKSEFDYHDIKIKLGDIRSDSYYNSGVMYVKDTHDTRLFFKRWHDEWEKRSRRGVNYDQPPLYYALEHEDNLKVKELSGVWNCQMTENGLQFLNKARILHFFVSVGVKYHKLMLPETYRAIRQAQELPSEIMELIKQPKDGFCENIYLGNTLRDPLQEAYSCLLNHKKNSFQRLLIRLLRPILIK